MPRPRKKQTVVEERGYEPIVMEPLKAEPLCVEGASCSGSSPDIQVELPVESCDSQPKYQIKYEVIDNSAMLPTLSVSANDNSEYILGSSSPDDIPRTCVVQVDPSRLKEGLNIIEVPVPCSKEVEMSSFNTLIPIHSQEKGEAPASEPTFVILKLSDPSTPVTEIFICGDCEHLFTNVMGYDEHCRTHNNLVPFKCVKCPKRFTKIQSLYDHMDAHLAEEFPCDECGKNFPSQQQLCTHQAKCQNSTRNNLKRKCHQCGFRCASPCKLQQHELAHVNYAGKCGLCGADFTNETDLNEHVASEHAQKLFKCPECEEPFDDSDVLKSHVSVHGVDVKSCNGCKGNGYVKLLELKDDDDEETCLNKGLCSDSNVDDHWNCPQQLRKAHNEKVSEVDPLNINGGSLDLDLNALSASSGGLLSVGMEVETLTNENKCNFNESVLVNATKVKKKIMRGKK